MSVDPRGGVVLQDGRTLLLKGARLPRGTEQAPELAEMARLALSGWIAGQDLFARIDSGPPDRWGRNPARLWLSDTAGAPAAIAAGLIEAGWALAAPETAEPACLPLHYRLELKARGANLGLWSDAHYRPVEATDMDKLHARSGQYLIVEGKLVSARRWRTLTFLNFGTGRGKGLSASISARARKAFEAAGQAPESLAGKRLRLRGLLEIRNGARMAISGPQFVEVID
ncbi:MAG: thermonuclease family protein [Beijerinckiaceae bacterium]